MSSRGGEVDNARQLLRHCPVSISHCCRELGRFAVEHDAAPTAYGETVVVSLALPVKCQTIDRNTVSLQLNSLVGLVADHDAYCRCTRVVTNAGKEKLGWSIAEGEPISLTASRFGIGYRSGLRLFNARRPFVRQDSVEVGDYKATTLPPHEA